MPVPRAIRHVAAPLGAVVWVLLGALAGTTGCGADTNCPVRYADADGDGFGDREVQVVECDAPGVLDGSDCDDGRDTVFPGAPELCNSRDDDCNGEIDDDVVDTQDVSEPRYLDRDADGFGSGRPWAGCGSPPPGFTSGNGSDCDDGSAARYPGAPETCNDIDDDCNGLVDDNAQDRSFWYLDGDGDGYGTDGSFRAACDEDELPLAIYYTYYTEEPTYDYPNQGQWVNLSGDCNDVDPQAFPDAPEVCNGQDDDCDGLTDENAEVLEIGWLDRDRDGFGGEPIEVCGVGSSFPDPDGDGVFPVVATAGDCDDDDPDVHPNARELCNGLDDDCDTLVDDADPDRSTFDVPPWHRDLDGDGFGDPATAIYSCSPPSPTATFDTSDCDDTDDQVSPDADEVCNLRDDDCDGHIDVFDPSLVGGPCF